MDISDWKTRLAEAIEQSGKSKRAISLESGNSPGYVHSILTEGKEPKVSSLIDVCDAIPVSVIYILHGHDVTPEDSEILELLHRHPEKRAAILNLISAD
jgi:hypothetical protein